MTILETLARVRLNLTRPKRPLTPYIMLKGSISPPMSTQVTKFLQKIPKRTKQLGVVISSAGGQLSQAIIIAEKLRRKAKQCDFEIITFAQQFALNSAFFLLLQGDKVYADRTTVVGGIQVGELKINLGFFSEYIKTVVYAEDSSFYAESKKNEPYSEPKATQMKQLYSEFSQQMKSIILQLRKSKVTNPQQIDFTKYYLGEEALKLGLIDGVGRIHQTIPKLTENAYIQLVKESRIDRWISDVKKIQLKK